MASTNPINSQALPEVYQPVLEQRKGPTKYATREEAREARRIAKRRYKKTYRAKHPERVAAAMKDWRRRNRDKVHDARRRDRRKSPEKKAARAAVLRAIADGKIVRPEACSRCGAKCIPEGHHPDHSKWLEVIWLCFKCHRQETIDEQRRKVPAATPR